MKQINEFLNKKKKDDSFEIEDKLKDALIEYANYYNYDATQLVYMINLILRDLFLDDEYSKDFNDPDKALKTFNKEFEKYQNIMI